MRQILEEKLGWKQSDIPRELYYRKIILKKHYIFLLAKRQEKTCSYNNVNWKFFKKENGEIELSFKEKEGKNVKIHIPTSRSALCREKTFIEI